MGALFPQAGTGFDGLDSLFTAPGIGDVRFVSLAWSALEEDETLDARVVDALAEILEEMEETLANGQSLDTLKARMQDTYLDARSQNSVWSQWLARAVRLPAPELRTELWVEFSQLVNALQTTRRQNALTRLQELERHFRTVWEEYRGGTVLAGEIVQETALCHQFLQKGLQNWLRALEMIQLESCDEVIVLRAAEQGQRMLVVVQIIEEEMQSLADRLVASWN